MVLGVVFFRETVCTGWGLQLQLGLWSEHLDKLAVIRLTTRADNILLSHKGSKKPNLNRMLFTETL